MKNILTITFLILMTCAMVLPIRAAEEPYFETAPVFDFDQSRPSNHASCIESMPNGDLLVTWFGGSKEGLPDVALWQSRRKAGENTWSAPSVLMDEPELAEGNSVLFTDPDGKVWLFYMLKYGEGWAEWDKSHMMLMTSDDSGETWTEPRQITTEFGFMVRSNALALPDGKILLPVYHENPMQSLMWVSGDGFETWEQYEVPNTEPSHLQPSVASLGDGKLIMFARHHTVPGKIWVSVSDDWGKTWRDPKKHKLNNPDSGLALIALDSGALVLAFNDSPYVRTPLVVGLSEDGGRSWPYMKKLETTSAEFSYPYLIHTPDGHIHLTYTSDGRKFIKHAEFNEAWLKSE